MKKHISILLFASLIITAAQAQNFEVGANAGITFNKWTGNSVPNSFSERRNTDQLHTCALSVMKNAKKWQYGLSFAYSYVHYNYNYNPLVEYSAGNNYLWFIPPTHVTAYTRDNAFRAFANRKLTTGRFETYMGASGGDLLTHATYKEYSEILKANSSMVTVGIQAGCTWYATKHIGINAEAGDEYNFLLHSARTGQMAYPVTLGIRYRL